MDKSNLNPCRTTSYTRDHWGSSQPLVMPYARAVDALFQTHMPERWAAQNAVATTAPDYTIAATAFSTISVNLNFATATHPDKGDLAKVGIYAHSVSENRLAAQLDMLTAMMTPSNAVN
jgi:2-oxoglutarate-Fe(II)-dependent dioxygenase family protein